MTSRTTPVTDYRLLAVDVDGTLMNSDNQLPRAHRQALLRAHHAGVMVCLCTGRSWTEAQNVIAQLDMELDAGVFVFGAMVNHIATGRTIARTPLESRLAESLVRFFQDRDFPVLILYDVTEAGVDSHLLTGSRNRSDYQRWVEVSPTRIEWVDHWPRLESEPLRVGVIADAGEAMAICRDLDQTYSAHEIKYNPIFAPNYGFHVVECFAPQVNKWYGLQQLMAQHGIRAEQVVAVGDDVNDLEMIRYAGAGVAMGNAGDTIKQAANYLAPSHDHDGLAAVVEAMLIQGMDSLERVDI